MKRVCLCMAFLIATAGISRADDRTSTVQERGAYTGTGRACAGQLKVASKQVAWLTPFSRCSASPFVVVGREGGGSGLHVTFRLLDAGPKCRYHVLSLTHDAASGPDIGWNVIGYPDMASYDPEKPEKGLSCYLVK